MSRSTKITFYHFLLRDSSTILRKKKKKKRIRDEKMSENECKTEKGVKEKAEKIQSQLEF